MFFENKPHGKLVDNLWDGRLVGYVLEVSPF